MPQLAILVQSRIEFSGSATIDRNNLIADFYTVAGTTEIDIRLGDDDFCYAVNARVRENPKANWKISHGVAANLQGRQFDQASGRRSFLVEEIEKRSVRAGEDLWCGAQDTPLDAIFDKHEKLTVERATLAFQREMKFPATMAHAGCFLIEDVATAASGNRSLDLSSEQRQRPGIIIGSG